MNPQQQEKILVLLAESEFGVIATHAEKAPESAVITLFATNTMEILLGSFIGSRKNKNIEKNPNVSLVIGWDKEKRVTMQLEGVATTLSPEERLQLQGTVITRREGEFELNSKQEYFKITPHWIRYSDFSVTPKDIWEVQL